MIVQTQTTSFKAEVYQAVHNLLTDTIKNRLQFGQRGRGIGVLAGWKSADWGCVEHFGVHGLRQLGKHKLDCEPNSAVRPNLQCL